MLKVMTTATVSQANTSGEAATSQGRRRCATLAAATDTQLAPGSDDTTLLIDVSQIRIPDAASDTELATGMDSKKPKTTEWHHKRKPEERIGVVYKKTQGPLQSQKVRPTKHKRNGAFTVSRLLFLSKSRTVKRGMVG